MSPRHRSARVDQFESAVRATVAPHHGHRSSRWLPGSRGARRRPAHPASGLLVSCSPAPHRCHQGGRQRGAAAHLHRVREAWDAAGGRLHRAWPRLDRAHRHRARVRQLVGHRTGGGWKENVPILGALPAAGLMPRSDRPGFRCGIDQQGVQLASDNEPDEYRCLTSTSPAYRRRFVPGDATCPRACRRRRASRERSSWVCASP